ncbi:MAG: hypothetical protein GW833_00130 [Desulfuromonadales bacterium]|nr:hypothetical protein [Desulfuromonadales bacterium]
MKKKLALFAGMLVLVAAIIIGSFRYRAAQQEEFYASRALPYIKTVIPAVSTWNPAIARTYMADEFLAKISAENFDRIVGALARLGRLEGFDEPQFEESFSEAGEKTILSYRVNAHYTSGPAKITISLLDTAGRLKVFRFNVESDVLAI